MLRISKLFLGLSLLLTLAACTKLPISLPDKEREYLASQNGKKLIVPSQFAKTPIKHDYVVPEVAGQPGDTTLLPPGTDDVPLGHEMTEVTNGSAPLAAPIDASQMAMESGQNYPALIIKQPFAQAWIAVSTGIRRKQMKIIKVSADKKEFFVVRKYSNSGRPVSETVPFCIQLDSINAKETRVVVLDNERRAIAPAIAARTLETLRAGMQHKLSFSFPRWFG